MIIDPFDSEMFNHLTLTENWHAVFEDLTANNILVLEDIGRELLQTLGEEE